MTKSELLLSLSSATLMRKEEVFMPWKADSVKYSAVKRGMNLISFKISMLNSFNNKSYYWLFSIYLHFFNSIFLQYSFLVHLYFPSISTAPFLTLPFFSMWLMKILIQVPRTFILLSAQINPPTFSFIIFFF